jgi:tetratricopeptide (TPR) repeat protein
MEEPREDTASKSATAQTQGAVEVPKPKTEPARKVRCSRCGIVSSQPEFLRDVRRSFSSRVFKVCPRCIEKKQHRDRGRHLWMFLAAAVGGLISVSLAPHSQLSWFLLNFAWFDVCLWLTFVPHEFAHAFVARAVGFRVFRVILGSGRTWWRGKVFGFDVEARTYLLEGVVIAAPCDTHGVRRKALFFTVAGPLANIAMFGLTYLAFGFPNTLNIFSHQFLGWQLFAFANLLVAATNLLPHMLRTQLGAIPSDGLQVFNLLFRPKTMNAQARHAARFMLEAQTCCEQQQFGEAREWIERCLAIYPDNLSLLYVQAGVFINTGELENARDAQVQLLAKTTIPVQLQLFLKNDLAYVNALLGVPELIEEADRYSAEAMNALPWNSNIRNTRGVVLLALGRLDEALPLLRTSVLEGREDSESMAQCQSTLAMAEARQGNVTAAETALEAARDAAPRCFLIPLAEAAVLAARGVVDRAA